MSNSDDLQPGSTETDASGGAGGTPKEGLGRRFLIGTALLGAGNSAVSVFNLAVGILLARLLGPEEFGLFAFVFGINELVGIIAAFSLGNALIQANEESQTLYDTAFAMSLGLGLVIAAAGLALAPVLISHRGPEAGAFIVVLTGSRVFRLIGQVPRAKLERTLRYDIVTRNAVLETSVPNVIALGLAWWGFGAWALVLRDVLVSVLTFVLESISSNYWFRRQLSRGAYDRLMSFAKPMFVARSIDILVERVDRVAVGAFLGNAAAGLLDRGRFLADMGLYVMRPVERASLNLLSRVQDDAYRSSRSYGLVNFFLVRLMFSGAIVLLLAPESTLRLVLGEEWVPAAPALRWLAIHAAIYPIYSMVKVLVIARNEVARIAKISAVQALILIPGTLFAAYYGSAAAVAAVVACTTCVGALLGTAWSRDLATVSVRRLFGVPLASALATAACFLSFASWAGSDVVPWFIEPFLVGVVFVAITFALEGRLIFAEFGYLRAQLSGGAGGPAEE